MVEENSQATLPRPGETVDGKYAIVRVIGDGGMGVVYEATHLRLRRRVALKMLFPHTTSPDSVARFEREARAAAQLQHRNVTAVLDVDTTPDGLPYLVMEFLEGHDLEAELQSRGALPVDEAVGYVLQACEAMTEAHAVGIVHRDLKPSNLFLTADKQGWVVKVLDFGISKVSDDSDTRLTSTQVSVGTPLYMSPEQVRSARNVDERTDIWSLGIILYELLTGHAPFEGSATAVAAAIVADPTPPIVEFREDLPKDLAEAIYRALAKDPAERFPNVAEFAQALAPFGAVLPPPTASSPLSLTPRMPSLAATPVSLRPSILARLSRPSYARATENTLTAAGESPAKASSSHAAVTPSRPPQASSSHAAVSVAETRRATPRRLLAMGGVVVLSVAALMALRAGRESPRPDASAPVAAPAPLAAMATGPASAAVTPAPPRPEGSPVDPGSQDTSPAVTAPPRPASKATAATPGARTSVRPPVAAPPPPSTAPPAPAAATAGPPPHGQSNPLFL